MKLEKAIRTRRTHKAFAAEPVDRGTLAELIELATWAPNHHVTNPWRFRVVGPRALEALKAAAGREAAAKLDRAPTLVAVSSLRTPGDRVVEEDDLLATACACYALLLGAHARGLAGYWRTPEVLRDEAGRAALGIDEDEHPVGLLYLGHARQERSAPKRAPAGDVTVWLD